MPKRSLAGSYKNVDRIFSLTDVNRNSPEIVELAETFGMMSVKVEAREFALEQTIEELKEKKAHVEHLYKLRAQLSSIFISTVLLTTFYIFVLGFLETGFITRLPNAGEIREYASRGVESHSRHRHPDDNGLRDAPEGFRADFQRMETVCSRITFRLQSWS